MTRPGVLRRVAAVAVVSTTLSFGAVVTAVADTAIVVGGFGTPNPSQGYLDTVLGGTVAGPDWTRIGIAYPATGGPLLSGPGAATVGESVRQGADTTYQTIIATTGKMIVTGTSEGSAVVDAAQARLVDDPKAPAPDRITFVYTAPLQHHDPALATSFLWYLQGIPVPIVDFTPRPPVQDSQYNTVVLAGEYDWAADFPDRPWNLLAVANSVMAGWFPSTMSIHGATALADPDPAKYPVENVHTITNSKGATITTVVVPTARLPLMEPLREIGIPAPIVDAAEKIVRPVIDAGYSRNDARHPLIPHLPPVTTPILGDHAAPLPADDPGDMISNARRREQSASALSDHIAEKPATDTAPKQPKDGDQPDGTPPAAGPVADNDKEGSTAAASGHDSED